MIYKAPTSIKNQGAFARWRDQSAGFFSVIWFLDRFGPKFGGTIPELLRTYSDSFVMTAIFH